MIKYQDNGQPSIINYNIPEPTSYSGRNLIRLEYDAGILHDHPGEEVKADAPEKKPRPKSRKSGNSDLYVASPVAEKAEISGYVGLANAVIDPDKVVVFTSTVNGEIIERYGTDPQKVKPAIYLVETYKLSNFLGDYGAGKVINTFSLLPGEKTKISVKSYKSSTTTEKESSSIFDSYKTETEDSFESSVQSENTDKQLEEDTFNYHVEAEAKASWGWGSAEVSGGVSGSSNSSRETFAANMETATNKHANSASAQRDITINTSSETTVTTGEEEALERIIENINTDRTLNFVFRQMNQEFISVLHLTDVKIGYYNGYSTTKREVPIADIDKLLDYAVKTNDMKDKIRREILESLRQIIDYSGFTHTDFIKKQPDYNYLYVNRSKRTEIEGVNKSVEGIVLMVTRNVLRTDGVIVEALLGQSDAHSPFTTEEKAQNIKLKEVSYQTNELDNRLKETFLNAVNAGNQQVVDNILAYYDKIYGNTEEL